jgi:branched-chain amino acid transport system permease protein
VGAGLVGMLFGAPAVRIKGFYLAMATLAAQFIIMWVIVHIPALSGGYLGLEVSKPAIGGLVLSSVESNYYLIMVVTLIMVYLHRNLARSRVGRAFMAVRDNDLAAEVMGINLSSYKLQAFFISAFYAGIAGCLWAHYVGRLHPDAFPLMDSIWYLGMLIVGGMGSTMGAIFGTVFIQALEELVRYFAPAMAAAIPGLSGAIFAAAGQLIFGLVVILFLVFEPRGLNHRWEIFKAYYRIHPFAY